SWLSRRPSSWAASHGRRIGTWSCMVLTSPTMLGGGLPPAGAAARQPVPGTATTTMMSVYGGQAERLGTAQSPARIDRPQPGGEAEHRPGQHHRDHEQGELPGQTADRQPMTHGPAHLD